MPHHPENPGSLPEATSTIPEPLAAPAPAPARGPLRALAIALAVLVVAAGIGGWMLGTLNPRTGYPTELSADAGFARDMQTHHNQAVQLSLIVRDRTDNEAVRSIAYDIATTQAQQSGQMFAWLRLWGLPQTGDRPAMAWMEDMVTEDAASHAGHGTQDHGMSSMGMASAADIERLSAANGTAADRLYLRLMIRHHQGGVAMAEAGLARAQSPLVLDLARKMVVAQESEINAMDAMLERLG
ncbi:DUF305 domain-containing protein [Arthrobacter halodurans]|uniref:DUF305 domain-containing protein n=1 Tax=Arthrobacter halodurans TaxID=516699 RepID=A0ABV4UP62_9MICC